MTMSWEKGRKLSSVVKNGDTTAFTYDSRGRRIRKTTGNSAGAVTTKYYYNGTSLTGLTRGNRTVQFVYDAEGKPFQMRVYDTSGSGADTFTDYFYLYNGQGDVTGLIDSSNTVIVRYTYDSWGKAVSATDLSNAEIATLNPFRYRGYVYDPETELYYLGSRYYDAEVERWISSDRLDVIWDDSTLLKCNTYIYCYNNPCNYIDKDGESPYGALSLLDYYIIHKMVQHDCIKKGYQMEVRVTKASGRKGYLDLYDSATNTYFEIKHDTAKDANRTKRQINEYNCSVVYSTGKTPEPDTRDISGTGLTYGIWDISYNKDDDGLITYTVEKNKKRAMKTELVLIAVSAIAYALCGMPGYQMRAIPAMQ